mgnify:CR=1 FL=1
MNYKITFQPTLPAGHRELFLEWIKIMDPNYHTFGPFEISFVGININLEGFRHKDFHHIIKTIDELKVEGCLWKLD